MKDIFDLINSNYDYYYSNYEKVKELVFSDFKETRNQIDIKIKIFKQTHEKKHLDDLYFLLNTFAEENDLTKQINGYFVEIFCEEMDYMVQNEMWPNIELIIDVLFHTLQFSVTSQGVLRTFFDKSIQILLQEKNDPVSEKEIATSKLIDILCRLPFLKNLMRDFLYEYPNSSYVAEIKKQLES